MNYDVLVIGGGPGGCKAAELAGKVGLKVALFEKEQLGGVCLNHGCIPTKSLLHGVKLFSQMRYDAPMFGVSADNLKIDPVALWKRTERTMNRMRSALKCRLKDANVEIIYAEAKWERMANGGFRISANGQKYDGKHLILATGGRPIIPKIDGINKTIVVTPRDLLETPHVPQSLVILGGGVIGLEFATIFAGLGSKVTVIEKSANIGGGVDERISAFLLASYRKRGIEFHLNTIANSVAENGVTLANREVIKADKILIACGWESSLSKEDDFSNIHIIGDANGQHFLAPVAEYEAEITINKILGKSEELDNFQVPHVIFSDPEVACWGMTLEQARKIDSKATEQILPLSLSARYAIENPNENGFGICVYSHKDELLGVHLVGTGVVELLATKLGVKIHPSLAELYFHLQHCDKTSKITLN